MRYMVFAVRDRAADVFGQPFFTNARGSAIRSFSDEVNNPKRETPIASHPEDFDLYELGSYDDQSATFEVGRPVQVAVGKDLLVVKQ